MSELDVIFPDLEAEDRAQLRDLAREERYPEGSVLIEEGRFCDAIFFIVDGVVSVTRRIGTVEIAVADLAAGEVVGEISFIDGGPVSATVRASSDVTVLRVAKADVLALAATAPELGMRLYRSMAAALALRLRQMTDQFLPVAG